MRWSGHDSKLIQRLNRNLCLGGQIIKTAPDGSRFVFDFKRNRTLAENVDPVALAYELRLLPRPRRRS